MVKDFSNLKAKLAAANTPSQATHIRDLAGAVERLHQSYANVYNAYSRAYVMMQELGTNADGVVKDYTDAARVSVAETALADKKREVRDAAAVKKAIVSFLNAYPLKSVSIAINTLRGAPVYTKIMAKSGSGYTGKFNEDCRAMQLLPMYRYQSGRGTWANGGTYLTFIGNTERVTDEIYASVSNDIPFRNSVMNWGRQCSILLPIAQTNTTKTQETIGYLRVTASLFSDPTDNTWYVLFDLQREYLDGPIDLSDVHIGSYILNAALPTKQERVTFKSGSINEVNIFRGGCKLFWDTNTTGKLTLNLVNNKGVSIPTLAILDTALDFDVPLINSVERAEASIFADTSGWKTESVLTDNNVKFCHDVLQDCQTFNVKVNADVSGSVNTAHMELAGLLNLLIFTRLYSTFPLPITKGNWNMDGSYYTEPMSDYYMSYITWGYYLIGEKSCLKASLYDMQGIYAHDLPFFGRSQAYEATIPLYAAFVALTRYADVMSESNIKAWIDSGSETVETDVALGDALSAGLEYGNETAIQEAIEGL